MRLINALGARVVVNQAGLTLVSTSWIKALDVELLKLHPGLVRNIEKRAENQLLVQSLVEACKGTRTRVFATGVRSRNGGRRNVVCLISSPLQPLDTNV